MIVRQGVITYLGLVLVVACPIICRVSMSSAECGHKGAFGRTASSDCCPSEPAELPTPSPPKKVASCLCTPYVHERQLNAASDFSAPIDLAAFPWVAALAPGRPVDRVLPRPCDFPASAAEMPSILPLLI